MSVPLLVLRPEPGASRTADTARALGLSPVVRPLFAAEARDWAAPDAALFDAVMMTSANAARHGGAALAAYHHLPLYAVGPATAAAAHEAGFASVITGDADAAALAARIDADGRRHVLHLAGEDRTSLCDHRFVCTPVTVYAVVDRPVDLPRGRAIALLHSPRAARRFAAVCDGRDAVDVIAISAATAAAAGAGWRSVAAVAQPDDDAILALAVRLCDGAATTSGSA